jgi:excisionase family DNA binding protein
VGNFSDRQWGISVIRSIAKSHDATQTNSTLLRLPLIDINGAAAALGISRRHVQRLVSERRIPFFKVGRFVRFDQDALSSWLSEQRVNATRISR